MKVGAFHLTYCSNIHPGETWPEVRAALGDSLPRIRELLQFKGPFGIGLRLSAGAAAALDQPGALSEFREFLRAGDYYVFTINGFPYGAFHGERVKERVYLPDWRDPARLAYSNRLATLLASFLSERPDIEGSVSTVPGAFKAEMRSAADVEAIASNLLRHAAHLVAIRERTGAIVTLAIEPEPACYIETTAEAAEFFTRYLFDRHRVSAVAAETRTLFSVEDVRRHIGICFDACHMAVEFEEPAAALAALSRAGIRVCKVQVSAALQLDGYDAAALRAALAPFAEDTYLHQVVEQRGATISRYTDLQDGLAAASRAEPDARRNWRVHFHVPIFMHRMDSLSTTQPYLATVLQLLRRDPVCPYLEVETYTWDVLPEQYRSVDVCTAIARELTWARATLAS